MTTISQVRTANPRWFDYGNKQFFNDISYRLLRAKSGQHYVVRNTYKWSDMFGRPKQEIWVVNPVDPNTLKIQGNIDIDFRQLSDVKEWLRSH
jgi:hypothetical protein